MIEERSCDICGRSEAALQLQQTSETPPLQIDDDGLWICKACKKRLITKPQAQEFILDLDEKLMAIVGKSAGAICRTLELPHMLPYKGVIEAASIIAYDQDRYMSAWLFVSQWQDGTTVWRDSNGHASAQVTPDGNINTQEN